MSEASKLEDSLDRLGATALAWREKAERYETALMLIAAYSDKTLIGPEADIERFYSLGAHAAFADCAGIANAALARVHGAKRSLSSPRPATRRSADMRVSGRCPSFRGWLFGGHAVRVALYNGHPTPICVRCGKYLFEIARPGDKEGK